MCAFSRPAHGTHQRVLDVERQAGGNPVRVDLVGGQPLRLQKDLVALLVGKAVDLVLHARAVARPHPLDLSREHRAAVEARPDDLVRALVGVRDPARHLPRVHRRVAHEAEDRYRRKRRAVTGHTVTRLLFAFRKVDRAPVESRRRAGLQARLRQFQFLQPRRQRDRRRIPRPARRIVVEADMNAAVQERACGQHNGPRTEANAHLRDSAHHPVALDHQVIHRLLEQRQVGLVFQPLADGRLVEDAVRLGAGGPNGRALGAVEDPKLDPRLVRGDRHGAAQRIDFLDQVPLADAADRRVAAHLAQRLDVVREQQRLAAHACRRRGRPPSRHGRRRLR